MFKLDELVGAPEHFENMARHMKETAASLQALQDINARGRVRGARRYRRRCKVGKDCPGIAART